MTVELAEDAMQKKAVLYDKGGDKHYDYISAWIKATRGSDVDASLYYLAVMLEGGEDPRFIARRMIVLASEDIGNADPQALVVAVAAAQAVEHVGHAGVRAQPQPGGRLPGAGAEVEREHDGDRPGARRTCGARARRIRPPYLQDAHYSGRQEAGARSRLRVSAQPARRASRSSRCCPRAWRTGATTSPPSADSRQSCGSGLPKLLPKTAQIRRISHYA